VVDPQLQTLGTQLGEVVVRNTAFAIADKIRAVKARRQDQETIAELEGMVNDLVADKSELVRIANAYEDELVAQRLAKEDIEYISNNLVPLLSQLGGIIGTARPGEGFPGRRAKALVSGNRHRSSVGGLQFQKGDR
jgi:hypothetical protein